MDNKEGWFCTVLYIYYIIEREKTLISPAEADIWAELDKRSISIENVKITDTVVRITLLFCVWKNDCKDRSIFSM